MIDLVSVLDLDNVALTLRSVAPYSGQPATLIDCISLYDVNFVRLDDQTQQTALDGQTVNGGACRDRTDDPLLAKQMLSQLS